MLFHSVSFLLFFGWVVLVHFSPLSWTLKKRHLLVASYLFYAAWNPPFVLLLACSTWVDWFAAGRLARTESQPHRKAWLLVSLVANLSLLGAFKYAGFLLEQIQNGLSWLGWSVTFTEPGWILPVGISFFTFQSMSYTLDVYHRRIQPHHSGMDFALYVGFFPQLVAGPIVRAGDFLPQLAQPTRVKISDFSQGLSWFIFGLFLKVVLADALFAPFADRVFSQTDAAGFLTVWLTAMTFTAQIFTDFAGYSLAAIGVARCLGFALPDNFRSPLAARGVVAFWRRWHISLSTWFRDYVYIPMGGNQVAPLRLVANLLLTMGLVGLWHGAAWTFVVWGLLHGLWLVVEHLYRRCGLLLPDLPWLRFLQWLVTFLLVSLLFVVFRAEDLTQAWSMISAMLLLSVHPAAQPLVPDWHLSVMLGAMLLLLVGQGWLKNHRLELLLNQLPAMLRGIVLSLAVLLILLAGGRTDAYIYFQF